MTETNKDLGTLESEFLSYLEDSLLDFFVYDRKECEELSRSDMKALLEADSISEDEFVQSCLESFRFHKGDYKKYEQ